MIKLKVDHDKFRSKLEKDPQMQDWYNKVRYTRAAFMHCRRFKTCPHNPFLVGKPNHKHDWEVLKTTVISKADE